MKKLCSLIIAFFTSGVLLSQPGIQLPFCDNFDGADLWTVVTPSGATAWQRGVPGWSFPSSVHSAPNVWQIGLNFAYTNNSNSYLISPKFNFNSVYNAQLSFWMNYETETAWDGARLEYSTDSVMWNILGVVNDMNALNWYSDPQLNCSNFPAWEDSSALIPGNVNGWLKAEYSLGGAGLNNLPQIWFRFYFCSDAAVTVNGFSIDDFCISEPAPIDAGITSVSFNTLTGAGTCNAFNTVLRNFGSLNLTQTTIKYAINGIQVGSYNWSGILLPATQVIVPLPCYTVPSGNYTICAYTTTTGDTMAINDTICGSGFGIPVYTSGVCHDFESNAGNFYAQLGIGSDTTNWEYGTPAYMSTTGAHSGTKAWDINLTTPYGVNAFDTLYSPMYDVDPLLHPVVSFWQNRNIVALYDGYWLEYTVDSGLTWNSLGTFNDALGVNWFNNANIIAAGKSGWDNNSNGWVKSLHFLNQVIPAPGNMQFRFIFRSFAITANQNEGVSIDDFCVNNSETIDAGVETIFSSGQFINQGSSDSLFIKIRNYGINNLTATSFYYSIDGGTPMGPYAWTGMLSPGEISDSIYLPGTVIPSLNFTICAWTSTVSDGNAGNDTVCTDMYGVTTVIISHATPYCNSFDTGNNDWINSNLGNNSSTNWELGTPNYGATTGAHSGLNAWDINLTTAYSNNANTALYSPVFDIPANSDPIINFFHNVNSENTWDGTRLEYTIDGGATWSLLGNFNNPPTIAINWYSHASLVCSSSPGWSSNSSGWRNSTYKALNFLNGQLVRFRFVFCSDGLVVMDGFSMDDFCISLSPLVSATAGSLNINSSIPVYFSGQCYTFDASFGNSGVLDISDLTATLYVDGTQASSMPVSFSPALETGLISADFSFPNCWTATPGTHTICLVTSNPNGVTDYNVFDDTLCITLTVVGQEDLTTGNSYCSDFETSQEFFAVNALNYSSISSWQYGLPVKVFLSDANSGTKAWVTKLNQNYPANDASALLSKVFILNTNTSYSLNFYTKFKTEYLNDGGTVQYSTDYGSTWHALGDYLDPQWMNTSNIVSINPSPPPNIGGWSGQSGWQQMQHQVCFPSFQGTIPVNVLFRFLFRSDVFTQDEGWEIDDFCLTPDPGVCTVGLNENHTSQGTFTVTDFPNPFRDFTTLTFNLPSPGAVAVLITDMTGKLVALPAKGNYATGVHSIIVNRNNLTPGIYFYSVSWEDITINGKMLIAE